MRTIKEPLIVAAFYFFTALCATADAQQYHAGESTDGQYVLGPGAPGDTTITIGVPSAAHGGKVWTQAMVDSYNEPADYTVEVDEAGNWGTVTANKADLPPVYRTDSNGKRSRADVRPAQYQQPAQPLPPPDPVIQQQPMVQPPAPRPIPVGAVLASRWFEERNNTSSGYWNHLCIYVGDGAVVESQYGIGVQQITWEQYRARPQHVLVLFPRTAELGEIAAMRAKSQIGTPYRRYSSVLPFIERRGFNCVSQVCDAYTIGGYRPRLVRPDDAFSESRIFAANVP